MQFGYSYEKSKSGEFREKKFKKRLYFSIKKVTNTVKNFNVLFVVYNSLQFETISNVNYRTSTVRTIDVLQK